MNLDTALTLSTKINSKLINDLNVEWKRRLEDNTENLGILGSDNNF